LKASLAYFLVVVTSFSCRNGLAIEVDRKSVFYIVRIHTNGFRL